MPCNGDKGPTQHGIDDNWGDQMGEDIQKRVGKEWIQIQEENLWEDGESFSVR
jgi:hypothetical protein